MAIFLRLPSLNRENKTGGAMQWGKAIIMCAGSDMYKKLIYVILGKAKL